MKRLFAVAAIFFWGIAAAFGQAPQQGRVVTSCGIPGQTYQVGNNAPVTVDQNGNLCGSQSGGGPGTVTGNVGGYDSGSAPNQTATPNSSSHAAGSSVGGLFSIPIARTNGGSGIITTLYWVSTGGATTQLQVRLWDKNPSGTTCTDQVAFVENATDDVHLLAPPFTMTPAAPTGTTGDTNTYAVVQGLTFTFKNQDTTPGKNVYACVQTLATDTADESHAVYINLTGVQD